MMVVLIRSNFATGQLRENLFTNRPYKPASATTLRRCYILLIPYS